jgi:hypothetical protein
MKTIHLLFCTLAITLASCDNNDDASSCESSLPPSTTTGANTFGACINGKLLIPRSGGGSFGTTPDALSRLGGYPLTTDYYELEVRDLKSSRTSRLLLHMDNVHGNGVTNYVINESNGQSNIDGLDHTYIHCRIFDDKSGQYQNYRSFENSGILTIIRYDYELGIFSGNFNVWVKNSANQNDSIQITNARFDINGYTLPNISFP